MNNNLEDRNMLKKKDETHSGRDLEKMIDSNLIDEHGLSPDDIANFKALAADVVEQRREYEKGATHCGTSKYVDLLKNFDYKNSAVLFPEEVKDALEKEGTVFFVPHENKSILRVTKIPLAFMHDTELRDRLASSASFNMNNPIIELEVHYSVLKNKGLIEDQLDLKYYCIRTRERLN